MATIREVETFLFTHGISAGLAARLVRRYGDEVVAVLTHEPYRLVELPRVGFKIADGIARSLGVELDDPQRLQAGLRFVLEEAESDGNTFLPLAELWQRAGRLLGVGELDPLESAVRALVAAAEIVVEGERVYRVELWEMERRVAAIVGERAGSAAGRALRGAGPTGGRRFPTSSGRSSSSCAHVRSCSSPDLPGAGKTHTQRALVEISRRARRRVLLCAPTGKAARRMRDLTGHEAMTIHRALGYSPNEGGFKRDEHWPLSSDYDLIIVDEASMLSLELADALFRAVGDCHVLLVGDTDQLPPIGAGPRARRSRRLRRRPARPPDRDLPAGGTLADHPERPADQRGRAAVPLARRCPRGAWRGCGARRGLLLHRPRTAPRRCARPCSSSSASESRRASGSIREPR